MISWQGIAELEQGNDGDGVWQVLMDLLQGIGIEFVIYLTVDESGQSPVLRTNVPAVYDLRSEGDDPFLAYCCNSYEPIYTGIEYIHDYAYLSQDEVSFIKRASKATGFTAGVSLPMRLHGSDRVGGFNLGTSLTGDEFKAKFADMLDQLRFVCLIAHRRLEELTDAPTSSNSDRTRLLSRKNGQHPNLSPRENEIMYLFSQGLSGKECATICQISPNTVAEYAKNAYKKLGAHNRVTAVQAFLSMGGNTNSSSGNAE